MYWLNLLIARLPLPESILVEDNFTATYHCKHANFVKKIASLCFPTNSSENATSRLQILWTLKNRRSERILISS